MRVFNEKNRSVFSNNVESNINLELSTKVRLLPNNDLSKNVSLYDQYNKERDECNKFRIILGINPICSNVLYNAKTEIVINEGSENVKVICDCKDGVVDKNIYASGATNTTSVITYLDAIRNTEYSHPELGGFKYHCGFDIFNNHMLRNNGYVHVNTLKGSNNEKSGEYYNTILDYMRDSNGEIIQQDVSSVVGAKEKDVHLYQYDTILSMRNAFMERCEERDGWWGFYNSSNINIPNRMDNEDIKTNVLLSDRKPCDFIDLYPDRSLYSFIPKYNKNRKRIEINWDYCITYPYENDYEMVNKICGLDNYSIRANFITKYNTNGKEVLECSSYFKHNLKVNDHINIYYKSGDKTQKYAISVTVVSVGDINGENSDRIFSIELSEIISIYNDLVKNGSFLHYKKVVNGEECQYYFRKFKKIKNIDGSNLRSEINKIAFGKNIYGDDVAQIIFTDDIDVSNLYDNNNRPISEVYFTVIKRNAGHDIWYEAGNLVDSPKSSSTIEYSHCFGEITSGLDFSGMKEEPFDYNIHRMHNLTFDENFQNIFKDKSNNKFDFDFKNGKITYDYYHNDTLMEGKEINGVNINECRTFIMLGDSVLDKPNTIESGITIDKEWFYGDVSEYNNATGVETIISSIYHRVNTAQRETFDKCFRDILQDKIISDDYDFKDKKGTSPDETFSVKTYYINDVERGNSEWHPSSTVAAVDDNNSGEKQLVYGNIMPEGNYYNPHTKIQLKVFDDEISESIAKVINYGKEGFSINDGIITLIYPNNYGFYKGDYIAFFNKQENSTKWGEIINIDTNERKLTIKTDIKNDDLFDFVGDTRIYYAYWSQDSVPFYANLIQKRKKFIWRKFVPQSKIRINNELYDTTFSNGRLYIEKNINFYLRRQDPFGKYGLSRPIYKRLTKEFSNPMDDFIISGSKQMDFTGLIYAMNNFDNCY